LVDKKVPLLGNRWFLGTAIKSRLRAAPYPDTRKQKDAAPKTTEGLHQKKKEKMMIKNLNHPRVVLVAAAAGVLAALAMLVVAAVSPAEAAFPGQNEDSRFAQLPSILASAANDEKRVVPTKEE
jgi:hypothetical protein